MDPGSFSNGLKSFSEEFSNIKHQLLDIKIDELRNYGITELRNPDLRIRDPNGSTYPDGEERVLRPLSGYEATSRG